VHKLIGAIIIAAATSAVALAGPEEPDLASAGSFVDELVARNVTEHRTAGVALAVTSPDKLLLQASYGFADLGSRQPVSDETLFQIGSVTKAFTAVLLLQLVDDGRLSLDRPITDALPWFTVRNDYGPITPHHLLTHTAGIPENRDDLPPSPFAAIALGEQAVAWPPGERFHYSNVGFQVLHTVIETVAGNGWGQLVRGRILEPLGMYDTEPAIVSEMRERQATGYLDALNDRPSHRSRPLVPAPFVEYTVGDGCIASTASDMSAFLRMLLNRGVGPHGRILSETAFEAFSTAWIMPWRRTGYGYGIAVRRSGDRFQLLHSGGTAGFSSTIIADIESGLGVVVLINGPGDAQELAETVLLAFRSALAGEAVPTLPEPVDPVRVDNAGDYAGTFTAPDGREWTFTPRGSRLVLVADGRSIDLEPRGTDVFYTPDAAFDRYLIAFGRDGSGRVVDVTHGPDWLAGPAHPGPAEMPFPAGWSAYVGRYVSYSPWFHDFTVFVRRGRLWAVTGAGSEAEGGDERPLVPLGGGVFKIGDEPTPETLSFGAMIDRQTWQASWSGHRFYRDRVQ
jgi:CubicO group peptidase (beta-lactamase class C family)